MVRFSILLCTMNRKELVRTCLASIFAQKYTNYEIIVVDQSDSIDEELQKDSRLKYLYIEPKGLSNARNIGCEEIEGEYIALIDDDAEYDSQYLFNADLFLRSHPTAGIVTGRGCDKQTGEWLVSGMSKDEEGPVSISKVFKSCISATLIIRSSFLLDECFDEEFGIGARYNAAEESDVAFRCIEKGLDIYYCPYMTMYHPSGNNADVDLNKVYKYSIGIGGVLKKHYLLTGKNIYILIFAKSVIRSIGGCLFYLLGKRKYIRSYYTLKGKIRGFKTYQLK